jgi:WD40 repeat protein
MVNGKEQVMKKFILLIAVHIAFTSGHSQDDSFRLIMPMGHTEPVHSATLTHDGSYLLTASDDKKIILWEVSTGRYLRAMEGHRGELFHVEVNRGNKWIASIARDRYMIVWDFVSGAIVHKVKLSSLPRALKFSPDGKAIVTLEYGNHTIHVWEASTGRLIRTLEGHSAAVTDIAFSPDGKYLLSGSGDKTAIIWELNSGRLAHRLNRHSRGVSSVKFNFDGRLALTASEDGMAFIWEAGTGKELIAISGHLESINHADFSPDGLYVATASNDTTIRIWSTADGKLVHTLIGDYDESNYAEFSPNSDLILGFGPYSDMVWIWDVRSGRLVREIPHGHHIAMARFLDNRRVLTSSHNGISALWNVDNGQEIKSLTPSLDVIRNSVFRDRDVVIHYPNDSTNLFLTRNCALQPDGGTDLPMEDLPYPRRYPMGSLFRLGFLRSTMMYEYYLHDMIEYDYNYALEFNSSVFGSANNNYIMDDNYVGAWFRNNSNVIQFIDGSSLDPVASGFDPEAKFFITLSFDNTAKIWEFSSLQLKYVLSGHESLVSSGRFSPDGKYIATGSLDNTVRLWDARSGSSIATWHGHTSPISSVDFKSDSKYLVSTSEDGISIIWDIANGKELLKCATIEQSEVLIILPSSHYMASPAAASSLHYIKGLQTIGFEQLDIKYNRPDKVLSALGRAFGNPDTLLIKSYYRAWQKRVEKLGVDTTSFDQGYSIPESDFLDRGQISYEQDGDQLTLTVWGKDADYLLDRFNVWVNEVSVFGQRGVSIRDQKVHELSRKVTITLSQGDNKIETSVLNVNGIESYRVPLYVRYTPPVPATERLYYVGIGVDRYEEQGHDLSYSAKDIRDLAEALKGRYGERIVIDTLFNERVTRENVLSLKDKLLQTTVNDKVIVSFSGHGLLDHEFDYYLATHAVDFESPSSGGLPYEDMEWLMDSIPSRKKLLLMDACHSGEVDKKELLAMQAEQPEGTRGAQLVYAYEPTLGMKNSFELMQELFTNVSRGTGATVISAAAGTQYAYEKGDLENGVFTYCILELLEQGKEVSVGDLKSHVVKRVTELTNGLQKPTSRNETIESDWRVW